MKLAKLLLMLLCAAFVIGVLTTIGMMINQIVTDTISNDSASVLLSKAKYKNGVWIRELRSEAQEIHKGYASIELIANYLGEEIPVPENTEKSNRTNSEFKTELKRAFPQYKLKEYANLKNSELIDTIYDSLTAGDVVIMFHSAENSEKGTKKGEQEDEPGDNQDTVQPEKFEMRYTVVVGMDLSNDRITLNNPYGYTVNYKLDDFIKSARFENDNYEMEFYERLAFAFRLYAKNKIYVLEMPD